MNTAKLSKVRRLAASGSAKSIRLGAAVSLPEVATEVGVATSTIWRWENGRRTPRGDAAERYCDLLDRLVSQ